MKRRPTLDLDPAEITIFSLRFGRILRVRRERAGESEQARAWCANMPVPRMAIVSYAIPSKGGRLSLTSCNRTPFLRITLLCLHRERAAAGELSWTALWRGRVLAVRAALPAGREGESGTRKPEREEQETNTSYFVLRTFAEISMNIPRTL